jgi:hypothetical protein
MSSSKMKTPGKASIVIAALILISGVAYGQLTIRAGTTFGFNDRPDIYMDAAGNITTNDADISDANFHLNIISNLAITGYLPVTVLRLTNGNVAVNNTLAIGQGIEFSSGLLTPGVNGRIVYAGESANLTGASQNSFVNGTFYQTGGGHKFYPVGSGSLFAPATFDNIGTTEAIGVRLVESSANLSVPSSDVISIIDSHYWELVADDPSFIDAVNTRVSLSLNNIPSLSEGSYAVMEAASTGSTATNLRYFSIDDSQVTSLDVVTNPIITIGNIKEITLKVRDLITPYLVDGENDKLYIEQIDAFDFNTVTLLDRWGVVVKRWEKYTNDIQYDFSQLGPGNYIVVVEYGNLAEGGTLNKVSQMVTVLKTN